MGSDREHGREAATECGERSEFTGPNGLAHPFVGTFVKNVMSLTPADQALVFNTLASPQPSAHGFTLVLLILVSGMIAMTVDSGGGGGQASTSTTTVLTGGAMTVDNGGGGGGRASISPTVHAGGAGDGATATAANRPVFQGAGQELHVRA